MRMSEVDDTIRKIDKILSEMGGSMLPHSNMIMITKEMYRDLRVKVHLLAKYAYDGKKYYELLQEVLDSEIIRWDDENE